MFDNFWGKTNGQTHFIQYNKCNYFMKKRKTKKNKYSKSIDNLSKENITRFKKETKMKKPRFFQSVIRFDGIIIILHLCCHTEHTH